MERMNHLSRNIIIGLTSFALFWLLIFVADILDFPPPLVTEYDEEIIEQTIDLFSQQHVWNKQDNRNCEDKTTLSLYCALAYSSLKVSGDFSHNSAALEQVREEILIFSKRSDYKHILMDFNNNPNVSIEDMQEVLRNATRGLSKKWEEKSTTLDWLSTQVRSLQSN